MQQESSQYSGLIRVSEIPPIQVTRGDLELPPF